MSKKYISFKITLKSEGKVIRGIETVPEELDDYEIGQIIYEKIPYTWDATKVETDFKKVTVEDIREGRTL